METHRVFVFLRKSVRVVIIVVAEGIMPGKPELLPDGG